MAYAIIFLASTNFTVLKARGKEVVHDPINVNQEFISHEISTML